MGFRNWLAEFNRRALRSCCHVHTDGMQLFGAPKVPLTKSSESNRLVINCAFKLAAVQLRLNLRDPALGLPQWLPILLVLGPLLSDLLRSRHALLDNPPENVVRIRIPISELRGQTYRFPNSGFASETIVAILLRFGCRDLDDSTKKLTLIDVVDCFFRISWDFEFDVAESSVRVR